MFLLFIFTSFALSINLYSIPFLRWLIPHFNKLFIVQIISAVLILPKQFKILPLLLIVPKLLEVECPDWALLPEEVIKIKYTDDSTDSWLKYVFVRRYALRIYQDPSAEFVAFDRSLNDPLLERLFTKISNTKEVCVNKDWRVLKKVNS